MGQDGMGWDGHGPQMDRIVFFRKRKVRASTVTAPSVPIGLLGLFGGGGESCSGLSGRRWDVDKSSAPSGVGNGLNTFRLGASSCGHGRVLMKSYWRGGGIPGVEGVNTPTHTGNIRPYDADRAVCLLLASYTKNNAKDQGRDG